MTSTPIYKDKVIPLLTKTLKLPNGRRTCIEMVNHPGAVVVVPFVAAREVVLLRQYRPTIEKYLYEFPAGTINPGETPLRCAHREVVEEAGYRASEMTKLGAFYPVPGYSNELITVFCARRLAKAFAEKDADEIIAPVRVSLSFVRNLLKKGQLRDAKTICALALGGWL